MPLPLALSQRHAQNARMRLSLAARGFPVVFFWIFWGLDMFGPW